jgi:hypothetical protein
LTFTSSTPVAVVALRQIYSEDATPELLLTNQPVIDLSVSSVSGEQMIADFRVGEGIKTQVVLVNPTGKELHGRMDFLNDSDGPGWKDTMQQGLTYFIKANSEQRFVIAEPASGSRSGSISIDPAGDSPSPGVFAIVSYKPQGVTLSEAVVPVTMGPAFRIYSEVSNSPRINTTVFIANPTDRAGTVTLSFTNLAGEFVASNSLPLGPQGRIAASIDALLSTLPDTMQGILRITSDIPTLSVASLRSRDIAFTAITPTLETGTPTSEERILPKILDGGGFTTAIVIYSGSAGETSQGDLNFVSPEGFPLSLDIH